MAERQAPSPEEIDGLHGEANVINDEVDKRKVKNSEKSMNAIAELAIRTRADYISYFVNTTEMTREDLVSRYEYRDVAGMDFYISPTSKIVTPKLIDEYVHYFETPQFQEDLDLFADFLPAEYIQPGEPPVVFMHSFYEALALELENNLGAANRGHDIILGDRTKDTISLIVDEKQDLRNTYFHERAHIQQPYDLPDIFKEGAASSIADQVTGENSHAKFIELYNQFAQDNSSHHPILESTDESGNFKFDLRKLLSDETFRLPRDNPSDERAADIYQYVFMCSFLSWFRENYDPELKVLTQKWSEGTNYHPVVVELLKTMSDDRSLYDKLPSPGDFDSHWLMFAVPDDDPLVATLASEIKDKSPDEIVLLFEEFFRQVNIKMDRLEAAYNDFINQQAKRKKQPHQLDNENDILE